MVKLSEGVTRLLIEARALRIAAWRPGLTFRHKMLFLAAAEDRCVKAIAIATRDCPGKVEPRRRP